jgi:hypothetical protein
LKTWRTLLAQCFENYEAGKHQICIPALLSILEGVLALPEKEYFIKPQERIDFFKNKVASSSGSTAELLWKTLDTFFAMLYAKSDFNTGSRPTSINRHWILHGRDEPDAWRPADALRLMHALSTVSAL